MTFEIFEFHKHTSDHLQCRDLTSLSRQAHGLGHSHVDVIKRKLFLSAVISVNDFGRVCLLFNSLHKTLLKCALELLQEHDDRAADQDLVFESLNSMQGILETIVASAVSRGLNDTHNGSIYLLVWRGH